MSRDRSICKTVPRGSILGKSDCMLFDRSLYSCNLYSVNSISLKCPKCLPSQVLHIWILVMCPNQPPFINHAWTVICNTWSRTVTWRPWRMASAATISLKDITVAGWWIRVKDYFHNDFAKLSYQNEFLPKHTGMTSTSCSSSQAWELPCILLEDSFQPFLFKHPQNFILLFSDSLIRAFSSHSFQESSEFLWYFHSSMWRWKLLCQKTTEGFLSQKPCYRYLSDQTGALKLKWLAWISYVDLKAGTCVLISKRQREFWHMWRWYQGDKMKGDRNTLPLVIEVSRATVSTANGGQQQEQTLASSL